MPILRRAWKAWFDLLRHLLLKDEAWVFTSQFSATDIIESIHESTDDIRQIWILAPKTPTNKRLVCRRSEKRLLILARPDWLYFIMFLLSPPPGQFSGEIDRTDTGAEIRGVYGFWQNIPGLRNVILAVSSSLVVFAFLLGVAGVINSVFSLGLFKDFPIQLAIGFIVFSPFFLLPCWFFALVMSFFDAEHRRITRLFLEWVTLHGPDTMVGQ